jgi:hypothetical protein
MGDDATRRRGPASRRNRSASASSVLTPPTGLSVPQDVPAHAPPVVPPPRRVVDPCVCRHGRAAHEHYRRGTDCGVCGPQQCARYRRRGGRVRRFLRSLGLVR